MVTIAAGLTIVCRTGIVINFLDLAPNYASFLSPISNVVLSSGYFLEPTVEGYFLRNGPTLMHYRQYFGILAGIAAVSLVTYTKFGSADAQPWNE